MFSLNKKNIIAPFRAIFDEFSNDKTCHFAVDAPIKYSCERARDERFFLRFTRRNKMSFSVSLAATRNAARRHYLYANGIKRHPVDRLFDTPLINCALLTPFFATSFSFLHFFPIFFLVNAFRQSASDTVTLLILKRLFVSTTFLI